MQRHLHSWLKMLLYDLSTLWVMAMTAVCCGFAVNAFRDVPLPLAYASKAERVRLAAERIAGRLSEDAASAETAEDGAYASESQTEPEITDKPHARLIDLASFRAVQKHALVLDARPEIFHRFGHIPKAISLPREDFEACYSKQRTLFEKHKTHPVVIYCSGGSCEDGAMVANALITLGFTDVRFYRGGWDEWTRIGLPEEKAL
jgi:rhodanese-related sulfurtransferase